MERQFQTSVGLAESTLKLCPTGPVEEEILLKGRIHLLIAEPDEARKRAVVRRTPRR